ncbi:hypothetical protein QQS21_001528 [Conoideocrella luteorostrata]|uniref:Rho-GAP domain-containing protein n=1 Tax=Conoideocrella luteorostrata TaxID=1105319 RepID=A0AAJ0CZE8_9HYPO|nr:hypothetical protein QQS21_001528 [Conoideocrella luteorostrata]
MGRKPTPQPLTLGDSVSNTSFNTAGYAEATGAMGGALPAANSPVSAVSAVSPVSASSAETAMHSESPANPRAPISQHSQPSPPSQPSYSQHSSPALTSRFAAGKRPQTAQTAQSGTGVLHTSNSSSTNDLRQSHRPPQLQLHQPQTRDDGAPNYPPVPSPYYDQTPGSASSPAFRHASTEGGRRPATKSGLFHFTKSTSKGSNQLPYPTSPYLESREQTLTGASDGSGVPKPGDLSYAQDYLQKPNHPFPSRSDLSLSSIGDYDGASGPSTNSKRNKSKSFGLLSRSKSNRDRDQGYAKEPPTPMPPTSIRNDYQDNSAPLRTAPVIQDRAFRDMMNSSARNRSEDRVGGRDSSRDKERGAMPPSLKENGSGFLSGLRNSSTKAADIISKGLFGKSSRSGSTTEREPFVDDEHYVLKVINLPLVEQTRRTRISKRLESSRDKTEFWMPAFPWRAIDYLNYKGCDVEGLYRVPGSGPQIKKWQRKFDEQYDVNLFEEDSLYDINIIGSMLKAWLRELPDELFPKEAQDRIARECSGATEVPQMLIDELADLSPFNYYLLFAITCHLSLLLAHSDKNKMDFRNLCICFQPCMKIDAFCFKFLVCDWRNCWTGCRSETKYIEEEYRLFDQPPPRGISEPNGPSQIEEHNDQQSSLDSSKPSNSGIDGRLRQQLSDSNASMGSKASSISTNVTTNSEREPPERTRDMRPLSPIKPLSPIGF